ncbi:LysM peptidoglycan-binding domain-containing protein [Agromyces sp. MMS24-K17]|uniref:LysM peptidoglycan-binding domain-containing protein n=1 Tax=Agromyces sp. MMS24-K17 TaxID=3372850 RepID=UPI003754E1B6
MSVVIGTSIPQVLPRPVRAASAPVVSDAPRTRLRLTRRGRFVFTALAAVPVVLLVMGVVLGAGPAAAGGPEGGVGRSFEVVTVAAGDTLWEIAVDLAPREDPRDVIDAIARLNGLDTLVVQPGQRLALPDLG